MCDAEPERCCFHCPLCVPRPSIPLSTKSRVLPKSVIIIRAGEPTGKFSSLWTHSHSLHVVFNGFFFCPMWTLTSSEGCPKEHAEMLQKRTKTHHPSPICRRASASARAQSLCSGRITTCRGLTGSLERTRSFLPPPCLGTNFVRRTRCQLL